MVNFNALEQASPFNALLQGFQTGREMKRQQTEQNALTAYAQNPNDQAALQQLTVANPQMGFGIQNQRAEQRAQQQAFDLKRLAMLDDRTKDMVARRTRFMGEQALYISQLPPQQQAQAWDAAVDQAVAQGFSDVGQYKGRYSPQALQSVLAEAGKVQEALGLLQPRAQAVTMPDQSVQLQMIPRQSVQFGGGDAPAQMPQPQPSDVGRYMTPQQAAQIGQGVDFLAWQQKHGTPVLVQSPEEAASLPSGTMMITPDGRTGVKR